MPEIYASANWYLAQPEPERTWRGLLQKRKIPQGPAMRTALSYALVTEEGELPVYAATVEELLAPLAGRQVAATGKLVDMSREGFGRELWIAFIEQVEAG